MGPESVTLPTPDGDRRYLLWWPPGPHRPLVLFLHGTGGSAAWGEEETRWAATAAAEGFALAVPDGLPPNPDGPPRFFTNPPRWNDGSPSPVEPVRTPPDDVRFLTAVVADAAERVSADRDRVYLAGFSNGAGMTFRFAAERPGLLAAVAPVAGYNLVRGMPIQPPVPTLFVIGSADPIVPPMGGTVRLPWGNRLVERPGVGDGLAAWAAAIGCDPTPVAVESDHGTTAVVYPAIHGGAEFRAVTVAGLGHHWPGGLGRLNPRLGGPPLAGIDGNGMAWNFFRRHARG